MGQHGTGQGLRKRVMVANATLTLEAPSNSLLELKVEQEIIKHEDNIEEVAADNATQASFQSSIASFAFIRTQPSQPIATRRQLRSSIQDAVKNTKKRSLKTESNPTGLINTTSIDSDRVETSPKKRKKVRGYAPPEVYAHLQDLQDILVEGLDIVFCGINPGQKSAEIGHHFGHPTNHFWGCLHESGFTSRRLPPTEDHTLPERFSLGLTNLVDRATAEQNELSLNERAESVPALLTKIAKYRPRILCFIGLGIAKVVHTQLRPSPKGKGARVEKFKEGLQPYKMIHQSPGETTSSANPPETLFYALPCTSGRVVHPQRARKIEMFKEVKIILDQLKQSELNTDHMHVVSPPQK